MDRNKKADLQNENEDIKPEKQTLHTTDPEKNMEGPVSSSAKITGKVFDSDKTQEEADMERDDKM